MSLFKKPSELEVKNNVKMLVYGSPGIGKSTIALSAPRPVLFDFDGGVHRVNGAFQTDTLQVKSWDEVLDAMKEDLSSYDTIVIDTVGKMLDYMGAYIIRENCKMANRDGSLTLKGYGQRKQMFIDFINKCGMLDKNLVFVAHEREDKDGETRIVRPEIGGSSAGDLIKELDLVGYMQAVGTERTIFWTPQEKFYAKNTCNLPQATKVQTIIDAKGKITGQNNFLTNVFGAYQNYLNEQAEVAQKYNALIDDIKEVVEFVTDSISADGAMQAIIGKDHIWDSKLRGSILLNEKCKTLGLKFNKLTNHYEQAS
jgi:phage nucleotide-binding protein